MAVFWKRKTAVEKTVVPKMKSASGPDGGWSGSWMDPRSSSQAGERNARRRTGRTAKAPPRRGLEERCDILAVLPKVG